MHQTKTGILLANLGTPDAPSPGAVKRYLRQFLSGWWIHLVCYGGRC